MVTLLASAVAGVLARRRTWLGVVFILLLTGLATLAALTAPGRDAGRRPAGRGRGGRRCRGAARPADGPAGTAAADRRRAGATLPAHGAPHARHDGRRTFLLGAGAVTLGAAGAGDRRPAAGPTGGPARPPCPRRRWPRGPVPQGLERKVRGISPLRTGNATFYRVDTNLTVPQVDADRWSAHRRRRRSTGRSRSPTTTLLAMPMIERDITLTCVSNEVGGGYVGAARWLGVRLSDVLERAGVRRRCRPAPQHRRRRVHHQHPAGRLRDGRDAMLAVGMNGEPLPRDARLPGPAGRARALRLRQRDQVARPG